MAGKRRIRTLDDLRALSEPERSERRRALRVISLARAEGWSVEDAAEELGVDMAVVRGWASEALGATRGGSTYPKPTDSIVRFRPLYVEGHADLVAAQDSTTSDLYGDIFEAQWRYINGEVPASALLPYEGTQTPDGTVDTDPEVLKRAALEEPEIDLYRGVF